MKNYSMFKASLIFGFVVFGQEAIAFDQHIRHEKKPYVASGEVTANSAVIWGRCNEEKEAYLKVFVSKNHNILQRRRLDNKRTIIGPLVSQATKANDYTASINVTDLKPNTQYYYKVACQITGDRHYSFHQSFAEGKFRTAPTNTTNKSIRFLWGADLAGQGWGRNPQLEITNIHGDVVTGGYVIFDTMRKLHPDFVIFQGDNIYADGPIPSTKDIPVELGGGTWVNEPGKDFVAITLDEFRQNWKYNLKDKHLRELLKNTSSYYQWDDHEVRNNWYPGEILTSPPYNGIEANVLAERSKQAFFEYTPINSRRIFRKFQYGKHAELFLLDERSFRGPNDDNSNPIGNDILGEEQLDWLKRHLKNSTATWKIISIDDPLGIIVNDGDGFDGVANDQKKVVGREVQFAEILKFIKDEAIKNVVFLTSDVHFPAVISYDPAKAEFSDFTPFYEFVVGPLHAGAFGPGKLDPSFGPQYEFVNGPDLQNLPQNTPPPYLQSFGIVDIDEEGTLSVKLIDITGELLFEKILNAE